MTIFLCGDTDIIGGETCWNCGGWVHAGDPPEVPVGEEPIGGHYCSTECHDEAEEFAERMRLTPSRILGCRECGLDNFEHEAGCRASLVSP